MDTPGDCFVNFIAVPGGHLGNHLVALVFHSHLAFITLAFITLAFITLAFGGIFRIKSKA